jgi:hypothetical protein
MKIPLRQRPLCPKSELPSKSHKGSLAFSILRSADNSAVLVEHRCGTKQIDMVFDDNEAIHPLPDLLIDKLPAEEPSAPALSLFQTQPIQSILASTSEEFSSDDESSISGDGLDFLDAPPPVDGDRPNNDYDVGQEERMFKQAKMYTDRTVVSPYKWSTSTTKVKQTKGDPVMISNRAAAVTADTDSAANSSESKDEEGDSNLE